MIWVIEESPNPGVWNIVQSRGIYKTPHRAVNAANELERWHREELSKDNPRFGMRYKAVPYVRTTIATELERNKVRA